MLLLSGLKLQRRSLNLPFIKIKFSLIELKCIIDLILRESDLNEVLQTDKIYTDVGKGELAKKKELEEHFKNLSYEEIIKLILDKGDIQVSEKEREMTFTNVKNEIANIIVEKTFDTDTGLKFSQQMVLQALDDANFVAKNDKSTKAQALAAIKIIQENKILTMERKFLEVKITLKENKFTSESQEEGKVFNDFKLKFLEFLQEIQCKILSKDLELKSFKILADLKPNFYRDLLTKFEDRKNFNNFRNCC